MLILSTAHSAKGKEWDAVFVIWAVDGWFPMARAINDDEELEEERRLMYVAMTRARNHLAVTYPLNSYATRRGADYSIDQLSRFIDRGVRAKMQRVVPRDRRRGRTGSPNPRPPRPSIFERCCAGDSAPNDQPSATAHGPDGAVRR